MLEVQYSENSMKDKKEKIKCLMIQHFHYSQISDKLRKTRFSSCIAQNDIKSIQWFFKISQRQKPLPFYSKGGGDPLSRFLQGCVILFLSVNVCQKQYCDKIQVLIMLIKWEGGGGGLMIVSKLTLMCYSLLVKLPHWVRKHYWDNSAPL